MSTVIEVENISKLYRLGQIGAGTLSQDVSRFFAKLRGKEDPLKKVVQTNQRSVKGDSEFVWSLRHIDFDVQAGEVLGIVGKNGAGKSTLLKILSRVTAPTEGSVKIKGRVASLLEVGTGFHPELTGKENIYLNGAILGMTKNEIRRKFDEIVEFSGVERYIETPVKRYSSGMYVRLAFAVAAHLEPEILIVDEVLAVGDAEFQKKCLGKMKDVSGEGRTVLFVSHNMAAVKSLCGRGILLVDGAVHYDGSVQEVVERYLSTGSSVTTDGAVPEGASSINNGKASFKQIFIFNSKGEPTIEVFYGAAINFKIVFEAFHPIKNALLDILILTRDGSPLVYTLNADQGVTPLDLEKGLYEAYAEIKNDLQPGNYTVTVGIHHSDGTTIDYVEHIYDFSVLRVAEKGMQDYRYQWVNGYIKGEAQWRIKDVSHENSYIKVSV